MKLSALFLPLVFFGALRAAEPATSSVIELFATPENIRIVRAPERVDACLLRFVEAKPRADGSVDRTAGTYVETDFVPAPPDAAKALRELLLNAKTYDWKAGNGGRRPNFYLRLRFHHGDEIVKVDFCFQCHVLNVTKGNDELGHANFSPNSDLILQALLKIFPTDEPLRGVAREAGLPL